MARALTVTDILTMKKEGLQFSGAWADAFGEPERRGIWFIWGQSGSGKTSFTMQLAKELCKFGKVAYDSLEEGDSLSMKNAIMRTGMQDVKKNFILLNCEKMADLSERMAKRRSPDFIIIDSFQYTQMSYKDYIRFKEAYSQKLIIFISHADGHSPAGRAAKSVMYDATMKIWVEGYKAFSKGRFFGPKAEYTIWKERAKQYWGE